MDSKLTRRGTFASFGAALAAPALAQDQAARVLRFVPQANLASLDPIWTTAAVVRNHGLMVWDTLYGLDAQYRARPQMAEGHEVSANGLTWSIRLREGLRFHDGEPVRARDAVASILRWSKRDALGQWLDATADEVSAVDDRTIRVRLRKPWPGLAWALGKPAVNVCAIMPERVARTDPFQQITEVVGSGPYRFRHDQFVPGALAVYERFEGYIPRAESNELLAGGKRAHFDRVEWRIMPDPATAGAALRANEVDWWELPLADLLPMLRRQRDIAVEVVNPIGALGVMRFNFLHPPFDNLAVRRALLPAIDQNAFVQAAMGADPALSVVPAGVFPPGTPLANDEQLEVLTGPRDLAAARAALRSAGYAGERIVLLSSTDLPILQSFAEVANDLLRRLGMAVDFPAMDWGTHMQRRTNRGPVDQGGWSVFCTAWEGLDVSVPGSHQPLRGHGAAAWAGWPTMPRLEELREAWFAAPDLEAERRIAREIQRFVFEQVPFIPLGLVRPPQAWRRSLIGIVKGGPPLFWGVRRA